MQTVKDNYIEQFTIICESDKIDEQIVEDLTSIIEESPGKTRLFFQIVDREQNSQLKMSSSIEGITLNHKMIEYIDGNEALTYQVN